MADIRVSQAVVEYAEPSSADLRVSQFVVEYANPNSSTLRVAQFIIEYIPILAPPPPPEPPEPEQPTARIVHIRRLRTATHLSDEQVWNFHHSLQMDIQAGIGLGDVESDAVGYEPMIMVRWSDDGGHTWSHEHFVSAGRRGRYQTRAMLRRLGRSRDRIYEFSVSDPVDWVFLQAFLNVTKGTS